MKGSEYVLYFAFSVYLQDENIKYILQRPWYSNFQVC